MGESGEDGAAAFVGDRGNLSSRGRGYTSAIVWRVLVLVALFIQWRRSDQRTAVRLDRAADRDDDADLAAYNNMLAKLAKLEER